MRKADVEYYSPRTDPGGPAMTWGMHAVAWLELGERARVASLFDRSFGNAQLPFLVWTETPTGGTTNFLTGVGGFLRTVLFGLPGLRLWGDRLALNPQLVEGMTAVRARGLHYRGATLTLEYGAETMAIAVTRGEAVVVLPDGGGAAKRVEAGQSVTLPVGKCEITRAS
jgi:trehalose/maltose hydrolase-like predicted phosphorylase